MSRSCTICQHLKRAEIDRRLAAGEPVAQLARDYEVSVSSLRRHRVNCAKIATSNAIKQEAARGTAAMALLPSLATLSGNYFELSNRADQIVAQAEQAGSLRVALSGLNTMRQMLDSVASLAAHDAAAVNGNATAVSAGQLDVAQIADCLTKAFDHEPEVKARIAAALVALDQTSSNGSGPKMPPQTAAPASPADPPAAAAPIVPPAKAADDAEQSMAPPPAAAELTPPTRAAEIATTRSTQQAAAPGPVSTQGEPP